jgi:4-diphosphocytidyl-2-C-methyl-D-erythritol kinase
VIDAPAHAKINLALVVGPTRTDGLHEIATIYQRLELADELRLEAATTLSVEGFAEDTLVRRALSEFAAAAGVEPRWRVTIQKRIPVAAGLGGGSSDAATAIRLACEALGDPSLEPKLHAIACGLGADVPFFLEPGPKLGTGDGTTLAPLDLPQGYSVVLLRPEGERKPSTGEIYGRFDREAGFEERRRRLLEIAARGQSADLAALPPNDLVGSPLTAQLRRLGAFRADVSGAGPMLYGLFSDPELAGAAGIALRALGDTWITRPAW